jgi:trans-aconitate methyltransferase
VERTPEPELMDDAAQALAYARADFAEPHDRFVALLAARTGAGALRGAALDLGCGPGDVTFRVARALPMLAIDAVDGADAMLALAREDCAQRGLSARVRFARAHLPGDAPPGRDYALVYSNSLLHHLADPAALWDYAKRWGAPGAAVFVGDLLRPESESALRALVERHAGGEPDVLRRDFALSLRAAYRAEEVSAQLDRAGLAQLALEIVSDRHWIAFGTLPR